MSELPPGWAEARFGDLNRGATRSFDPRDSPDESFELYSVPAFPSGLPEVARGRTIGSTKQVVEPDDVLVCKINPRINRVWQVGAAQGIRQIASSEWIVMRAPELDARFLRYLFSGPDFREHICQDVTGVGGSLTRAQPLTVASFTIPIAPLPEQRRIADKLDSVLSRVDACRAHLERVPAILKRFRQSVLAAATSGELTEDWRGQDTRTASWVRQRIRDVTTKVGSGATPKGGEESYRSAGVPLIRSMNVVFWGFKREGLVFLDDAQAEQLRNVEVRAKDILLNITGASIGRVTLAPNDLEGARVNQHVCIIRPTDVLLPEFLCAYLAAPEMQNLIGSENYGVTRQALTKEQILDFEAPVPPLAEQREIVDRVQALFVRADRLEARHLAARAVIDRLTPVILAKAFRGELVPQDPNDEPASALLERIRLAREAQLGVPKKRTNVRKPEMIKLSKDSVREAAQQFPQDTFSFEDLRQAFPGNYELLKDIVFDLLDEPNPSITQEFDADAKVMRFVRSQT